MVEKQNTKLEVVITDEALLKEVTFNYEQLKTGLSARLKKYKELVVTEEAIDAAKADRAGLNKLEAALKDKQKEIQQRLLGGFDTKLKELRGMVSDASGSIDVQVKAFEQEEKDEKKTRVRELYDARIGELKDVLLFSKLFDERYLNKGFTLKAAGDDLAGKIDTARKDLSVIDQLKVDAEIVTAVKDHYLQTLDLSGALAEKARLEEQKAKLAKLKAAQEAEKAAQEKARRETAEIAARAQADIQNAIAGKPEPVQELGAALQGAIQEAADFARDAKETQYSIWLTKDNRLELETWLFNRRFRFERIKNF
jgi:hypothetical protein